MPLGSNIKRFRYKAGLTQEQLGELLGVSAQSVSKWETAAAMPDITLLPRLAEEFGVSIDDLFDLTKEQKLRRIERRMEMEEELSADIFREYEALLQEELSAEEDRKRICSLLAHLYHHRMQADAYRVSRYAREAIRLAPAQKDCQWLLQMAEGDTAWDWNVANHARSIAFYKELVDEEPHTPLPYYYLIDNLLSDHRIREAEKYLEALEKLPCHSFMVPVYRAYIALAQYDEEHADALMEQAVAEHAQDGGILFEAAQYYARKCDYEKAIAYYEASYESDASRKPRYVDALQGMAVIYEILGENQKAAAVYDRILENLRDEWGFTEEAEVQKAERERTRLLQK